MATLRKTLGDVVSLAANAFVQLYLVPAATDTVVSSIVIVNTTAGALTFRVCNNATATGTLVVATALAWDVAIPANSLVTLNLGITVEAARQLGVGASATGVTFQAFGQENT